VELRIDDPGTYRRSAERAATRSAFDI